jgi:hypothetical protein
MPFNLIPFVAIWSMIALAVIFLLVWRKMVASKEDDQLHVLHGAASDQSTVASKLDMIDKWGKILTVIAVVSGLLLGAAYVLETMSTRGV